MAEAGQLFEKFKGQNPENGLEWPFFTQDRGAASHKFRYIHFHAHFERQTSYREGGLVLLGETKALL
jgi:hypothetical protein